MTYKIALIGDWHGSTKWARQAIWAISRAGVQKAYHLGDFGLGWPHAWGQYINEVAGACIKHNVYLDIVPGNHENYDWINSRLLSQAPEDGVIEITGKIRVLPRNYRETTYHDRTILALGGAPSIDFRFRQEGRSWWKQEMLTLEDVEKAAEDGHADVMLCHDAPDGGTDEVQRIIDDPSGPQNWGHAGINYAREGRELMNMAVAGVQPKLFAHGHYHTWGSKQVGETMYIAVDQSNPYMGRSNRTDRNVVILDLEDLSWEWLDING